MNKLSTILLSAVILAIAGCSDPFTEIFDGKSLEGWECDKEELTEHWKVEEGLMVAENPDSLGSNLWTLKSYRDYELELEYLTLSDDYDTGVFPRGKGTQVQIGISRSLDRDMTACIYAPKDGGESYPAQTDKVEEFHKLGEWNHLRIIVAGQEVQTFLNDEPFVDYESPSMNEEGPVGLQLHGNVHMKVKFRNIRIREIPAS